MKILEILECYFYGDVEFGEYGMEIKLTEYGEKCVDQPHQFHYYY